MRRFIAIAIVVAFAGALVSGTARASIQDKIQAQSAKVHDTHAKLQAKQAELQSAKSHVYDLQGQLAATNHNIDVASASLDEINASIHVDRRRLAWNQVQLDAAEATLKRHNDALNRRLVDAYENGDLGYINVLLSATSFSDFVERWDDIRYLIEANENTVRQRKAAAHQVNVARIALLVEQQRLQNAQSAAEQKRQQLAVLADQRRNLLAVAQSEQSNVAQAVSQLEEISQADEDALEALIQERQREEEERRRAAAEAARRAALLSGQEPPPSTAGGPSSFSWPVTGPITSPFGARVDPVIGGLHVHTGIDIGAPSGTTIGAAADGHVIFAGSYGGYGNAIIIDHGGSVSTLYGHCSQIFVGVGQDVQRGQAIGAVGMTGYATGPHLHFEVRIDGRPQDPMSYLH